MPELVIVTPHVNEGEYLERRVSALELLIEGVVILSNCADAMKYLQGQKLGLKDGLLISLDTPSVDKAIAWEYPYPFLVATEALLQGVPVALYEPSNTLSKDHRHYTSEFCRLWTRQNKPILYTQISGGQLSYRPQFEEIIQWLLHQ